MKKKVWIIIGCVAAVIALALLARYVIYPAFLPKQTDPKGAARLYLEKGHYSYRYPDKVRDAEYDKWERSYNGNPPSGYYSRLNDAEKAQISDIKSYKVHKADYDSPAYSGESESLRRAFKAEYGLTILRVAVVPVDLTYNNGTKEKKDIVLFETRLTDNITEWYVFEISDVGDHSLDMKEYRRVFSTF